jgi:penicillin-binding protein 2
VAVLVQPGGNGATTAGPIARKIMDAWLLGKMPEPEVNPDVVAVQSSPSPVGREAEVRVRRGVDAEIAEAQSALRTGAVSSELVHLGSAVPSSALRAPSPAGRREAPAANP